MTFKELITILEEYKDRQAQVDIEQPNPFQVVITISK
jgi:hypothetical protein